MIEFGQNDILQPVSGVSPPKVIVNTDLAMQFGQLISGKAEIKLLLIAKVPEVRFYDFNAPTYISAGGAYRLQRSPGPLAGFTGPTSKGTEGREGKGQEGMKGKGGRL